MADATQRILSSVPPKEWQRGGGGGGGGQSSAIYYSWGEDFPFRGGGDGSVSLSISPLTSANQRPAVRLFLEGWGAGGRGDTRGFGRQWDDESDTLHCQCVVSAPACQGLVRYTTNRRSQRPHPPLSFFFFSGRLICPAASSWALGRVVVVVGVSPD